MAPDRVSRRTARRRAAWLGCAAGVLLVCGACGGGGGSGPADISKVIERFPSEGRNHIDPSVVPVYHTDPPTSGDHYPSPTPPGFFDVAQQPGNLVHALEHGNIVIYYDPARVPPDVLTALKNLAARFPDPYGGVIVTPRMDAQYVAIATAWTVMMRQATYNPAQIDAFIAEFRAKGPEN